MSRYNTVLEMLQNFSKGRLLLQKYEKDLEHYRTESLDETIEGLSFKHSSEERVQTSGVSDATYRVVSSFRQINEYLNMNAMNEILLDIKILKQGLESLETTIRMLSGNRRDVLELLYLKGHTWAEVQKSLGLSRSGVNYARNRGIDELCSLPPYCNLPDD